MFVGGSFAGGGGDSTLIFGKKICFPVWGVGGRVWGMSIMTRRGDEGMTDLMFGRRVAKTSLRFGALGAVDELNAVIGVARAAGGGAEGEVLERVQKMLFSLMGELACLPEDGVRYEESGYGMVSEEDLAWLVERAVEVEEGMPKLTHWALPGGEGLMVCAYLDHARAVARRAERCVLELDEAEGGVRVTVRVFLNRVSDLMWILARGVGARG